ncbi:alpha/beta hydrolase [Nonomuraea soli]|uniref:Pimeloyl-ACP methyl ester carboxylesterase n=1 Tax=Nonomuraea soli TaxID=1032476 RepID=A0A7W0CVF0_9ACTN|nr:alpha/beta hydrolase family protein [Nonomuraea soli]MBA2897873.1 pimeloyl-ACP methyl ester carboxylesterase [Nonomuraea soli]
MTTFILIHGAWHGSWAWDRLAPFLRAAGSRVIAPDLTSPDDRGLHDDVQTVVSALDAVTDDDRVILVGHSYAGLVVRQAADLRPDAVDHIVLVDGWAGGDGQSMLSLAPGSFAAAVRAAAETLGDGRFIPAPPPELFGVGADDAAWLAVRLLPQPLRTFTDATRLSGAVDKIPGTAIHCRPETYPFDRFGREVGYRTIPLDGPHDVMLSHPERLAEVLLHVAAPEEERPAL